MADKTEGKVCPECKCDMSGLDPIAHALSHWPEYLDPGRSSAEARRRQKATNQGGVTLAEYEKIHS